MRKREKMYLDYKTELCKMDGYDDLVDPVEIYLKDVEVAETSDDIDWVTIKDGSEEVCFIIVLCGSALADDRVDYEIVETYVKPGHRRKRCATYALNQYFIDHPGKYKINIMKTNVAGHEFWGALLCHYVYDVQVTMENRWPKDVEWFFDPMNERKNNGKD